MYIKENRICLRIREDLMERNTLTQRLNSWDNLIDLLGIGQISDDDSNMKTRVEGLMADTAAEEGRAAGLGMTIRQTVEAKFLFASDFATFFGL